MKTTHAILTLTILLPTSLTHAAEKVTITVQTDKPGARINPAMWGVFFEDINFGADGGLYAELVKNRSFEFPEPMMGWSKSDDSGKTEIREDGPFNPANPHYLRISSDDAKAISVSNEGFRGMGVRKGETNIFSAQVRAVEGSPSLGLQLVSSDGKELASAKLDKFDTGWKKYSASLVASATDPKAKLSLIVEGKGALDLDMVSLFPQKTWKNRPGGLRADMVQMLADLKPGFVRFPGGCIVEGSTLDRRYQWKTTIGPIEERKLLINRWNYEFRHRPAPDYFQSFGLGFFEFFQMCEDIGAEPLPVLNCGMACQFNTGELVPLDKLDPYIQDALDLIEFANGPATSKWGAKRVAMGHPEPFNMKMLGIGNEQWGPQYIERLSLFTKTLKEKHPEIMVVSSSGPSPADTRFDFLWPRLRELKAEIVDEHCYANPVWFFSTANRYDRYDRSGPKVFMGEYAAQSVAIVSTNNRNNLECALSEAAFMTGLERNADVVRLSSYAPLFAHVDGWQWTPNLIWADNLRVHATPNYYVQQFFSRNCGDVVLPLKLDGVTASPSAAGGIGVGTYQTAAEFKDVRVTRGSENLFSSDFSSEAKGWSTERGSWAVKDDAFQQTDPRAIAWARIGDSAWADYTLTLKARKLNGREGFIIAIRELSANTRVQWNLGGWGNQSHGIQSILGGQEQIVTQTPGSIESGRWYDLKIELKGAKLDCYLEGKLVQSAEIPVPRVEKIYASAVWDETLGEVILKIVNPGADATEVEINLDGAAKIRGSVAALVLAGNNLNEVNSLDRPRQVSPALSQFNIAGPRFTHGFPRHSLTVLRIKAK
jgi:alpha-L-arabinofuranosidase